MAGIKTSKRKGGKGGKAVKRYTKKANGFYSKQSIKTVENRRRKRLKHVKEHPNDEQTKRLL